MRFGKGISAEQGVHANLLYLDYQSLRSKVKDVAACQAAQHFGQALSANSAFEESLAAEIGRVNACFAGCQAELLARVGALAGELQQARSSAAVAAACGAAPQQHTAAGGLLRPHRPEALRALAGILGAVDELRKYAVWNAVAVVRILKKRRKHTGLGLQDAAGERAGWLSRQAFFSGADFAELHAAVESLGRMLALPGPAHVGAALQREPEDVQQCPICLDDLSDMVELSCSHRFCWKCFVLGPIAHHPGAEYRLAHCPICRRETSRAGPPYGGFSDQDAEGEEGVHLSRLDGSATRSPHTDLLQAQTAKGGSFGGGAAGERVARDIAGEVVEAVLSASRLPSARPGPARPRRSGDATTGATPPGEALAASPADTPQLDGQVTGAAGGKRSRRLQLASSTTTPPDLATPDSTAYACCLCSEPLMIEAVLTTPCKHHFHRICVERLDAPKCPLCSADLPFSWFLPPEHPCAQHGFHVVAPRGYQPQFPGGPDQRTGGYPLSQPPPVVLYSMGGTVMQSYLHRCLPEGGDDSPTSPIPSALGRPRWPATDCATSGSESPSGESGSDDRRGDGQPKCSPAQSYAYSAIKKMRVVPWVQPEPQADAAADAARSGAAPVAAAEPQATTVPGIACPTGAEQRNRTVLRIGDLV